jgi:hypothetical protein
MPAFKEFPIINVVQPAYHCLPNGGHGSFFPSGKRLLSCVLVLATIGALGILAQVEGSAIAYTRQGMLLLSKSVNRCH